MGVLGDLLAKLGIGSDDGTDRTADEDGQRHGTRDRTEPPAEATLRTKAPREDNAIWSRFDSLEVRSKSMALTSTDGEEAELNLAGGFDLREEKQVDGSDAVYQLSVPPATYDSGTYRLEVLDHDLQTDAPDLPLEGFEESPLDFGGETFGPESGEDWVLTVVFLATENEGGDAYVLETALEWERA